MITRALTASRQRLKSTAGGNAAVRPSGQGRWVLAATILGSSLSFIDGTVVNVALPALQRSLHASASEAQWVIEAYALFLSALILVGGSLGDRLGRRLVYVVGIALFTAASAGCGLAPNTTTLIVARAIQGIGGALLVPGSLAIIGAFFGTNERGTAIGTWSAFTTVTSALGPVLGGWLVQIASWRWVFYINLPLAAVALWLVFTHVPESRDESATGGIDWWGAILATVGLGGVVFGLIQSGSSGFNDAGVLISLVGGIVALGLFVAVEARSAAPMMPLHLFRSRTFSGANLLTLLLYGALGGALYFVPFDLQQVQGYSPAQAGAALLPFTVIIFALSRWSGGLITRYGSRLPLVVGPIIVAAGFALYAMPDIGGSYWTTFFPAIVVLALGMALVIAPLTTTVMNAVSQNHSGVASGINNAMSRAAGLLAIAILGLVMVTGFNSSFDKSIGSAQVTPTIRHSLDAQRSRLAAIQIPSSVAARARQMLRHDIGEAFVAGFRATMLVAAFLAVASAVAAALLIEGRKPAVQAAGPSRAPLTPQSPQTPGTPATS